MRKVRGAESGFACLLVLSLLVLVLGGCAGAPPNGGAPGESASAPGAEGGSPGGEPVSTTVFFSSFPSSAPTWFVPSSPVSSAASPALVRIGALLPLSGELAEGGNDCLAGMRLAVEEVNAAGGIQALGGAQLGIVTADTKGDPKEAATVCEQLAGEKSVCAVVGAYQSAAAITARQVAERLRIPLLISVGAADEITEGDQQFVFRLCPKAEWYARDQVRFLVEGRGPLTEVITKAALLHEEGDFGRDTAAAQRQYLEAAGIKVVQEISYPADQAEFSRDLLQIKNGEAEAVLTATYLDDAVFIVEAAEKVHLGLPLFDAGAGTADAGFVGQIEVAYPSLYTELEYCLGTSALSVEKAYSARYGRPLSADALYSYQAVWVLATALERAGATDRKKLRLALATTAMPAGEHMFLPQALLSFDAQGQNKGAQLLVAQIKSRSYIPVWPPEYARQAATASP